MKILYGVAYILIFIAIAAAVVGGILWISEEVQSMSVLHTKNLTRVIPCLYVVGGCLPLGLIMFGFANVCNYVEQNTSELHRLRQQIKKNKEDVD